MSESTENLTSCSVWGREISVSSGLDCFIYSLPYTLDGIGFGYITITLLIPILLISIFGKIKESYRFFILNQVLWDLFVIYDAICDNPADGVDSLPSTCFYSINPAKKDDLKSQYIAEFFNNVVYNAMYAPLCMLALSRFLAVYCYQFYRAYVKPKTIFAGLVIVQIICIISVTFYDIASAINTYFDTQNAQLCDILYCTNSNACQVQLYNSCTSNITYDFKWWISTLKIIKYLTAPLLLLFADVFAILVIIKVATQLRYQAQNHREAWLSSIKITIVLAFQCSILTLLCLISMHATYANNLSRFSKLQFPTWFDFLSRDYTIQWLSVVRIFCDSIAVMILLTDYRKTIVDFVRVTVFLFVKPQMLAEKFISKQTKSTVVSSSSLNNKKSRVTTISM